MERIKEIKDRLINTVQNQLMLSMDQVNTRELGEVVDMIKDLEECLYYCVLVKKIEEDNYPQQEMYEMMMPRYYGGGGSGSSGSSGGNSGGGRGYSSNGNSRGGSDYNASARGNNARGYSGMSYGIDPYMMQPEFNYPAEIRDFREGRSPMNRRSYMESKERTSDKNTHMKELDRYLQELATDINEMIEDSSMEEKTLLQQKLSTLANKIKQ